MVVWYVVKWLRVIVEVWMECGCGMDGWIVCVWGCGGFMVVVVCNVEMGCGGVRF